MLSRDRKAQPLCLNAKLPRGGDRAWVAVAILLVLSAIDSVAGCAGEIGGGAGIRGSGGASGIGATGGAATTGGSTGTGSGGSSGSGMGATGGAMTTGGVGAAPSGGAGASGGAGGAAAGGAGAGGDRAGATGTAGFVHPGLLLTATDLTRMKARIAGKTNPWPKDYNELANNNLSSTTRGYATPPAIIGRNAGSAYAAVRGACELDATAAYQNALIYAVTGQTAHADYAVKLLNAYAAGVKHFDGADPERDLEAAILGWLWVETAELIRYAGYGYAGWSAGDLATFNAWIYDVVYSDAAYKAGGVLVTPPPNGAGARGAWVLRTKMAIGIYLENTAVYQEAVDYFFHGQGNGAPRYYVLPATGQTWEAGRDQGHAMGGLCRLMETAHMAHNQGNETLYAWGDNALSRASEYIASYNLGNTVPYTPMQPFTVRDAGVYPAISATGRGMFATVFELPYHYWHDLKGAEMPYTWQAITAEGSETYSLQFDNPMFGTLSFRE